jgi:hypothetical protein
MLIVRLTVATDSAREQYRVIVAARLGRSSGGLPMNTKELLDQVTIPTPCTMAWDQMPGDDWVRHCQSCGKHVYNFSRMTVDAAPFLALAHAGELCGRITLQADGTPLTPDRQPELLQRPGRWQFRIRSIMGVIAGVAATLGFARLFPPPEELRNVPAPQLNTRQILILSGRIVPRCDLAPAAPDKPSNHSS